MRAKLILTCCVTMHTVGCSSSEPPELPPADAYIAATELAERLPVHEVSPAAMTRPGLVGTTLFTPSMPAGADLFSYAFVEAADGRLLIHKTGGFAGVSEWRGPIPDRDRLTVAQIEAAAMRERDRRE